VNASKQNPKPGLSVLESWSKNFTVPLESVAIPTGLNHLKPNGHYMGLTAQLTSRCCILYIYSTNIGTEYFKHAA